MNKLPETFLFTNTFTRKWYNTEGIRKLWRAYSGIDVTLCESMRHSTISDWTKYATAYETQMLARHTDQRTTKKYIHEVGEPLLRIVDRSLDKSR
jgi:hypothetical protein